jgi:hypothetical protein
MSVTATAALTWRKSGDIRTHVHDLTRHFVPDDPRRMAARITDGGKLDIGPADRAAFDPDYKIIRAPARLGAFLYPNIAGTIVDGSFQYRPSTIIEGHSHSHYSRIAQTPRTLSFRTNVRNLLLANCRKADFSTALEMT